MNLPSQIAKHLRDVYFGNNWTAVNLKNTVADINWQQATTKVQNFNTIAVLVYHTNYFIDVVLQVLQGEPLNAHDKYSFDLPPVESQQDWENLLNKTWTEAERLACLTEQLPESKLDEVFIHEKYGNYLRNLFGIIEHTHYHLGQITLIKKMILLPDDN